MKEGRKRTKKEREEGEREEGEGAVKGRGVAFLMHQKRAEKTKYCNSSSSHQP